MQSALGLIFPPQCISCETPTDVDFALCADCWRDTPFVSGLICDLCGDSLLGREDGYRNLCDACATLDRPWSKGRSVMRYQGNARRLILALKHGDRPDLARATAPWLARAARPLLTQNTVIVPIPIHWTRLLRRRYNQSCELSRALAKELGIAHAPQALVRPKHTRPHEGMSVEERFANMQNALIAHPQKSHVLAGKNVLLLDDVMTSGATFDAATRACLTAGSQTVQVLTLARASRDA